MQDPCLTLYPPLEVESVQSRIPICHCPCQGAGWPDKYRRMSKPWHSPLPTQPKPTTATRICPTSLPILRLDNIHASHSIPVDHVQCGSLDLFMHHYCQSSSVYRHLQTSLSLNLIIRSYAPDYCPDDIHRIDPGQEKWKYDRVTLEEIPSIFL